MLCDPDCAVLNWFPSAPGWLHPHMMATYPGRERKLGLQGIGWSSPDFSRCPWPGATEGERQTWETVLLREGTRLGPVGLRSPRLGQDRTSAVDVDFWLIVHGSNSNQSLSSFSPSSILSSFISPSPSLPLSSLLPSLPASNALSWVFLHPQVLSPTL